MWQLIVAPRLFGDALQSIIAVQKIVACVLRKRVQITASAPRNDQTRIMARPHCALNLRTETAQVRVPQSSACSSQARQGCQARLRIRGAGVCVRMGPRLGVVNEGGLAVAERAIPGNVRIGCGSSDRGLFLEPRFRRS